MKMKILIVLIALLLPNGKTLLSQIPDCMCPPLKHPASGYLVNQDSAFVIDTCRIRYPSANCDSVYWKNMFSEYGKEAMKRVYAKHTWLLWFNVEAFPLPVAPSDTIIEVTWEDVDSLNYPEVKTALNNIATTYGNFKLKKTRPQLTEPIYGQTFEVFFENYVNVLEIEKKFNNIPYSNCDFISWLSDDYPNIVINSDLSKSPIIFPNPTSDKLTITFKNEQSSQSLKLFSITGIKLNEYNLDKFTIETELDLSPYPNGIYFLQIGNEMFRVAVIK
jgi:hypothetical protein